MDLENSDLSQKNNRGKVWVEFRKSLFSARCYCETIGIVSETFRFLELCTHIIFKSYDSVFTATHSKVVINEVIRKKIKFKGILISDDISLKSRNFKWSRNRIPDELCGCTAVICVANFETLLVMMFSICMLFLEAFQQCYAYFWVSSLNLWRFCINLRRFS